jgi:hypothetical protein
MWGLCFEAPPVNQSRDTQEEARQFQNKELAECGRLFLEAPPVK